MNAVALETLSVDRVSRAIDRFGDRLLARVFREAERAFCTSRRRAGQHFAARLAAKIAARRLLGGRIALRDVEIERDEAGAPQVRLHGAAARMARDRRLLVSLSHDAGVAVALVVLAERDADR